MKWTYGIRTSEQARWRVAAENLTTREADALRARLLATGHSRELWQILAERPYLTQPSTTARLQV